MPSRTDQLIESISTNEAFTAKWPYDPKKPLDSLPWYPVWLGKQARLMETVAGTDDRNVITDFCVILDLNKGFMDFLAQNRITHSNIVDYAFTGFPEEEKKNVFRLYRIWIDDQFELINDVLEEERVQKGLGAEGREHMRANLAELERVIASGQEKKGEINKQGESLDELKAKIIKDLGLGWKPKDTSPEKLEKELDRRIKSFEADLAKREKEEKATAVPKGFKGTLDDYAKLVHAQCESVAGQIHRLLTWKDELLTQMLLVLNAREESVKVQTQGKSLLQTTRKGVNDHITEVSKSKKGLDSHLTSTRSGVQDEMERLYTELNPLLNNIAELNNEILVHKSLLSRVEGFGEDQYAKISKPLLERLVKDKESRLGAMYDRKDQIFLRIGHLQGRLNTVKTAYEEQLADERDFEETAKQQLNLLKQIPRIEQALNIYCSSYKGSFPLFLYVGSFIRGDGDIVQSPSLLGKGMDLLLKLPMVGGGLTDIEKCKAYDTGSMNLSLKLGLSVGVDGGFVAKAGLAVEYNAGMMVQDDRMFQTVSEFALKAAAKFEIPEFFEVGLELEIAKWKGGFTFQDHYHWAAWLAARWGHFCARARACDVYLSKSNVGPDHRPDQKALAELDRLTEQILNDNEMIQTVYAEIRQYLDYPVIRSKQSGFFESGKLNMKLLGLEVETEGDFRPAEPDMMIVEYEHGKAVEYEAAYSTWSAGGSITLAGYTVAISYQKTDECPISQQNGIVINVQFSPVPPVETWVALFDIFMGVLTGTGDIKARVSKLFTETFKLALQTVIKKFAADYILEKTKIMEFNFYISQGTPVLQYVRTRVEFGKSFETSVPVYEFIYIDLGAEFKYARTFGEGLGYKSITYHQYVHHGFMGIPRQRQPMGKQVYTLRPDSMSGEELWKKYVEAHKHDIWHLFLSIGTNQQTVRKELAEFTAKTEVRQLISLCEERAANGRYKLPGEGLISYIPGFFGSVGQVNTILIKHLTVAKNQSGFEEIGPAFNAILPAFNSMLEAEYRHIKQREESEKKTRFKRVNPPPKTVSEEVGEIFQARDDVMFFDIGWASQLQQETGKDMKSCVKCLKDVKDYDDAREVLLAPVIPTSYWVDDKDVSSCTSCRKTIQPGVFSTNKHHCRICGGIFCDACCPSRAVPAVVSKSKIRVCRKCLAWLNSGVDLAALVNRPKPKIDSGALKQAKSLPNVKTVSPMGTSPKPKLQSVPVKGVDSGSSGKGSLLSVKKEPPKPFTPKETKGKKQETAKGGKPGKPGAEEWYSDDHINWLMNHYLAGRQDTSVVAGISAHLHGGGTLRQNLQDCLEDAFLRGQNQMVVPINIHENHWVGVHIRFPNNNFLAPRILHVDPQGNDPTADVVNALTQIFPQGTLNVSHTQYQVQGDGINCGPWTVALLEYLAKHGGAAPAPGEIDIAARRRQDTALL